MATESWMRATDRDREETVEILRWAYAEGQLNLTELDERAEMAFRARTAGELRGLIADISPRRSVAPLPSDGPGRPGAPRQPRRSATRRSLQVSLLVLLAVLAGVLIGAVTRDTALIALAIIAGCVAKIRIWD
jgi:hypothetical protein